MVWLFSFVRTGKNFSNKIKIFSICVLKFLKERSPHNLQKYFDYPVRWMMVETDVKFCIRTVYDFFVFSPIWERQLEDVFQFREGMTFLDVGAHIGRYTVRAAVEVGQKGRVIAVEPDRNNFRLLVQNLNLNGISNCIPLNIAAYCTETEIVLFTGTDSAKHSVKQDFGKGSQKVKAKVLDNVLKEIGVEKVDLIKIDVEEAEYEVVRGLENTLRHMNPTLIIEILKKHEDQVIRYLNNLGYQQKLVHSYVPYKGGIMYYCFKKHLI